MAEEQDAHGTMVLTSQKLGPPRRMPLLTSPVRRQANRQVPWTVGFAQGLTATSTAISWKRRRRRSSTLLILAERVLRGKPTNRATVARSLTDAQVFLARGYEAVTLIAHDERGGLGPYHQTTDVPAATRDRTPEATRAFALDLVAEIDRAR